MSTVMNEGVKIRSGAVTAKVFAVVGLLVEPSTSIEKPKVSFDVYIYIGQPSVTVTYYSPVISSFLFRSFVFSSIL